MTAPSQTHLPDRAPSRAIARIAHRVLVSVLLALAAFAAVGGNPAAAQIASPEAYEDRPIREIRITTIADDGGPGVDIGGTDLQRILNTIRSAVGSPYRGETVLDDVTQLNRLGIFRRVESFAQQLADGGVVLYYAVEQQSVIQDVQVTGNRRLNDAQLAAAIDLLVGTPIDRFQIDRAARRIEDLYREKGYYLARVTVDLEELEASNIVLFRIREGQRVRVTDIQFEGNETISGRLLRREVDTNVAGLLRTGEIDDLQLDRDVAALVTYYRNRGYLDVRADRVVRPSPNSKEAVIIFLIDEGPVYTLRDVTVRFAPGYEADFTEQQIEGLLLLNPGDVYAIDALQVSVDRVLRSYWELGYPDAVVNNAELRDPERPVMDLLLTINTGPKVKTGFVEIGGNNITREKVIRRHLDEVVPERPLDRNAIERSERRLRQLRLFSPLPPDRGVRTTIQPEDPANPGYRDVLVEITETDTGEFALGGAVSSDAGVVGRIALTQRNFDIADTPDTLGDFLSGKALRGAGQTFNIELQPGNEIQTYSIGLSEPYLFESDYSGSATVFFRDRIYREFTEQRYGGRFGLGRRFGTRWQGNVNLRLESVELSDIEATSPVDFFDVEEQNVLIGIRPGLTRTSLDKIFLPSSGSRTELSIEQVAGDFNFTTLRAEHAVYVPIRQDFLGRDTVIKLEIQTAYQPQGEDEVPTYERMYLGGASFRGFEFRTISPRGARNDNGQPSEDPVGGTWMLFTGAEIRQPLYEDILHLVGFVDAGTVTNEIGVEDYRVSVGLGLRFSIPQLSPAPIALDFGFPIVDEETDEGRLFTFSVDLPF